MMNWTVQRGFKSLSNSELAAPEKTAFESSSNTLPKEMRLDVSVHWVVDTQPPHEGWTSWNCLWMENVVVEDVGSSTERESMHTPIE
ncbi:hypothetical protein PRIPAC_77547 [Pristionchus pacificus]|uniref:Uncharacterized protein n=1 Tax=Pristionchus pacificus TaxID=54126 RepID=A0A2A6C440_PRIPA|nr:hypothetical protein PRIPAC_77547 [Pristionchus pacificus]|eukprot:PDM73002.1 hypothetical protein PRIPAC_39436 [Pristionchus pacificus]